MDWSQEKAILENFEATFEAAHVFQQLHDLQKLQDLQASEAKLKAELDASRKESAHRFVIISELTDMVKRYRCIISQFAKPKGDSGDPAILTEPTFPSLLDRQNDCQQSKRSDLMSVDEPDDSVSSGITQSSLEASDKKVAIVVVADEKSSKKKTRRRPANLDECSSIKLRRIDEISEKNQIRYPTADDLTYKDTAIGQTIWSTIIKCFRKYQVGMITERMIIDEGGKHVFAPNENFLDRKMIQKYFTHPFTYSDQDQRMVIRPVVTGNGKSWMVLLPDWLQTELKSEMCLYQPM